MSHTRVFLVLCALAFTLALALVRPLAARADDGDPAPPLVSTTEPAAHVAPVTHQVPVVKQAPKAVRRLQQNLAFGKRVVGYAKKFVGVPYVYGGSSPRSGFDCSGFVRYVYAHFGVSLPHSSYAQFGDGHRVSRRGLRPGDLVFFDGLGHVGLYIGNGKFIHAPHTGTRVRVQTLAGWYSSRFAGARRLRRA